MAFRPSYFPSSYPPQESPLPRDFARALCSLTCTLVFLAGVPSAKAQMHKVDKPEQVTRAIGVYEWTGNLPHPASARLVPVTLFIDGHLEDAGVYLARPVPFVLQTGVVYSIEKAGEPFGTLNLDSARDIVTRRASTDDNPVGAWYGYGTFAAPKVEPVKALRPSKTLPVITSSADPDKPHFSGSRSDDSSNTSSTSAPAAKPAPSQPDSTKTATPTSTVDVDTGDDDRPHMTRRADNTSSSTGSGTGSGGNQSPDADDPDRPTLKHRDDQDSGKQKKSKKNEDTGYVEPMSKGLNDDPDRPVVHRGKPLSDVSVPQLTGNPASMHQAIAVSDATNRDAHEFARNWDSPAEHDAVLSAMEELARPRIQNYLTTNQMQADYPASLEPASPAPATKSATRGKKAPVPPPPPPPLPLANEQLAGYTLSYGGLPTFVYSVETPLTSGGPVFLTLVAQRLPSGEIQVSLASVTDANHLDRTPWLRLVDAVDPDASHRASLLFELRAQSSRQFALYRLISAHAEQTFATTIIE